MKTAARLLLFVAGAALLSGCVQNTVSMRVASYRLPKQYSDDVRRNIANSANEDELFAFLDTYRKDRRKLEAAAFLVANMPHVDAVSLTATELREHVDLAFRVRKEMPWGGQLTDELFLHYVLPHRVSGEPHERWRSEFYRQLSDTVKDCESMSEAALKVNVWCRLNAKYKASSARDQGPLTTIRRGYGRCEEEMILYVCAARSVGLPARQCYTPRWQHSNSNHAWVEVWADGGWHFLGACEPAATLDSAWFDRPSARAAFVVSTVFGEIQNTDEPVYRRGDGYTMINSTGVYTKTGTLEVFVTDKGRPVPDERVILSVFNFGMFSPIASVPVNEEGRGSIELGPSTVFAAAGSGDRFGYKLVSVRSGETSTVEIDISESEMPKGKFLMTFGTGPTATVAGSRKNRVSIDVDRKSLQGVLQARLNGYKRAVEDYLGTDENPDVMETSFAKALLLSVGNVYEILEAHRQIPDKYRPWLEKYVADMEDKQRLECVSGQIVRDVVTACERRERLAKMGFAYSDEVFEKYVLHNYVYGEHYTFYRDMFPVYDDDELQHGVCRTVDASAWANFIESFIEMLDVVDGNIFGNIMTPPAIFRSGTVTDRGDGLEKIIFFVAAMRASGVPARYDRTWDKVEYFDGQDWRLVKQLSSGQEDETGGEKQKVSVSFEYNGERLSEKQCKYFRAFAFSRFHKDGYFSHVLVDAQYDEDSRSFSTMLAPGSYYVTAAKRNALSEPEVNLIPFEVTDKPLTIHVNLDHSLKRPMPIVRNPRSLEATEARTLEGKTVKIGVASKDTRTVYVFFDTLSEPSTAMMPIIAQAASANAEVRFVGICIADSENDVRKFVESNGISFPVVVDDGSITGKYIPDMTLEANIPSVLVLDSNGAIILWVEGHTLSIGELINKAME
ncbi:MAG: transglutaminase domain-containing protein [Planctomycetota bacterium]|nr:transglutaminase domain-containing protein [Planctomycetota bacterium]